MRSGLVIGGCGALGRAVIEHFRHGGLRTVSVDFLDSDQATKSIKLSPGHWGEQLAFLEKELKDEEAFDVIYCAAGGWAGGSIESDTASLVASIDKMLSFNLYSSIQTAKLASLYLKKGGLVVFTGAAAALGPCGGMLGYGISKVGTHHVAESIVDSFSKKGQTVLSVLPVTLDTPANRSSMPNADFSSWTPVSFVARTIHDWTLADVRPESGSMFKLITEHNVSRVEKIAK